MKPHAAYLRLIELGLASGGGRALEPVGSPAPKPRPRKSSVDVIPVGRADAPQVQVRQDTYPAWMRPGRKG